MTDQEFVLCKWKRRLWPAKVLCQPGDAGSSPVATTKRMGFKAEILGLEKQVSVSSANAVPLTKERIEAIASTLEQKRSTNEAVEELQYRCSLKIALDVLQQTDLDSQMPPAEGPNPQISQEKSAPPTPSCGFLLRSGSKKSEPEAAKRRRKPQNNCGLKDGAQAQSWGGSVAPEGSGRAPGGDTNLSRAPGGGTSPARAPGGGESSARTRGGGTSSARAPGGGTNLSRALGGGTNLSRALGGGTSPARAPESGESSARTRGGGTNLSRAPGGGTNLSRAPGGGIRAARAPGGGTNLSRAPGGGTNLSRAPGGGTSSARTRGGGTNPARCSARGSCVAPAPESHSCSKAEPGSSPRQRKIQPRMGNGTSCKAKAGRSQQGRKRGFKDDSPQDPAQVAPEEGSPLVPSESGTVEPPRKTGRAFLDSSCGSASDELEKSISSESESLAKQLDGRREAEGGKHLDGAGVASGTDRKCRSHLGASPGPSGAFPQLQEEENQDPSQLAGSKGPDSEEEEGLESLGMSSRRVSSESLPPLSPLADEEEEDFPSVLSHRVPKFFEEGMLVWCKLRRYPYWPAVVKAVKRKHRRACVLFIDGTTNEKKKGFSVSLRSLKHFDCEEKQELIERAKENYSREIEWCLQLILDYRIRVGCHSFTGSFLEYFAADISSPVRKEGSQSLVQLAFPNSEEPGSSDSSPQKPPRKLLPDRTRAARDRENKKLVEFIVKSKGAEEHLLGILKSGKQSRWLKKFLNSGRYMTCVETYLEDEEQLDLVVGYLKEVYREMDTRNLHQILGDGIRFISDVLLPEAIICAIAAVDDIDYEKAEEKYIKGPPVSKRERELFDEQVLGSKKLKAEPEPVES